MDIATHKGNGIASFLTGFIVPGGPGAAGRVLAAVMIFTGSCSQPGGKEPGDRNRETGYRNVVVIVSDDHSAEVVGCYGNALIRTPNIDRIAEEGVRFTNAYSNAPICSASRQSLLTGKYPHATGVTLLFTPFNDHTNLTLAEHLGKNGFATGLFGKTHFNDWVYYNYWEEWPDYGFDTIATRAHWRARLKEDPPEPVPPHIPTRANTPHEEGTAWQKNAQVLPAPYYDKDSDGTFLAGEAVGFIRRHAGERFFAWVAFHEPHAPFNFPVEYAGRYDPGEMPLPQAGPEDERWIPEIFRGLTDAERRGIVAAYYTSVEYMDKNVGLILDELERSGLDDETLVVYLSDQGYLLNEHGRFEKHTMWAESVKAPLVFGAPGIAPGVRSEVVEFTDLVPTLCEAVGVEIPPSVQGRSLMPLPGGGEGRQERYAFSEYLEDNMAMVASKEWKYVFTTGKRDLGLGYATGYGPAGVTHMLYDLKSDPGESTNLAYRADYRRMVDSLQGVMLKRFVETHPDAGAVPPGLNTTGKLIWFCEPRDVGEEPGSELQRIFERDPG